MKRPILINRQLKLFLLTINFFLLSAALTQGQVNLYTVSVATGTITEDMSGFTPFFFGGQDNTASTVQNIGFNFTFNNVVYTQFSANSNGLMRLGSTVVSTNAINQLTTNSDFPKISPYWDDLNTGTVGYCGVKLIGVAPNRKLSVEWILSIPKNSVNTGKFQVWLYEATNVIQYVYNTGMNSNAGGYSVGLAGSPSDYISVVTSGSSATSSTSFDNTTNSAAITSGMSVIFTPPLGCVANSTPLANSFGNSTASQLN